MSHKHDRSQTPSILVHEQVQVNKDKKNINIDIAKSQQNAEKKHRHTNGYTVHLFYCEPWKHKLNSGNHSHRLCFPGARVPSVLIMLSSTGLFLGAWPCNAQAIKRLGSCSPRLLHRTNHGGDFGGTPVHPLELEKKHGSHVQIPESFQQTNNILSFHL